jgi:cytochrome c553
VNSQSKIKILVIGLFFALSACVSTASKRKDFVIADSKSYEASLYRQHCAICHGNEANGKEINGVLTPSLRFGDIEKRSEAEIYTQIHDGKLPMPAFKQQLTEKEIRQMVRFIRRDLQGKEE